VIGLRSQFGTSLFLAFVIVLVSSMAAAVAARRAGAAGRSGREAAARVLAAGAVLVTIVATALPRRFGIETDGDLVLQLGRGGLREWRNLFVDPLTLASIELVANILLYSAIGFTMTIAWYRKRRFVVIACVLLSVLVETAQYLVLGRVAAVDDVLLNMVGAVIGYLAAVMVFAVGDRSRRRLPSGRRLRGREAG